MKHYSVGRIPLACIALFIACLLNACNRITPTQDIRPTEFSVPTTALLSPTIVQNLNPVFGEQRRTIESTSSPRRERTITPSVTPVPSVTPAPTETLAPSQTPLSPITWASGIPLPSLIEQFKGSWLPLQQMMVGNFLGAADSGAVSLALGPRFNLEPVSSGTGAVMGSEFAASPNGRWVLFGSVDLEEFDLEWNELSTLTRLNLQDDRLQPLLADQGSLRLLSFPGWLDGNTAAISDYAGGGFYNYSILDIANNDLVSRVQVHGPAWRPNSAYLPIAEEYGGPYRLFVLSRSVQTDPFDTLLGPNVYTRGFPSEYIAPEMNAIFKDWLSDTNRMLVQAFLFNRSTSTVTHSQLMLWSVDTSIVQIIVQAAIDGKFSPDGRQLAFVTMGAAPLTLEGQPSFDLGPQVPTTNQSYLQLMDINTRKVLFSLPAITMLDRSTAYTADIYNSPVLFSSDSRFLAFLTPGLLLTDQTGKLIVLPVSQENSPFLSVLDLPSFQPLLSTPLRTVKDFYFSPSSDLLAFLGKEGNWYLMKLATGQVLPLTAEGGERLDWNGWSYDGSYFSFYQSLERQAGRTYIFGPIP